jgi:two-component system, NarL family, response regulator DevR
MNDTGEPGPGGTAPDAKIKVFLLDDHEIVRRGVLELLEGEPDIAVVGDERVALRRRATRYLLRRTPGP